MDACRALPIDHKAARVPGLVGRGQEDHEIASIRGVSTRAVEELLKAAKDRLDAQTPAHAMSIAMRRQWI